MMKILFLAAIILPFNQFTFAETAKDFHSKVESVYSFTPCDTNNEDARNKYREIDSFRKYINENTSERIPLLRNELMTYTGKGFFLFDGASLLMDHSSDAADLNLVISSFSRVEMCGIDTISYFARVHQIGLKGIDIFPALVRIIDSESFKAYFSDHTTILERDYAVLFCSLVSDEKFWLDKMILKLASEENPSAAKTLITAIAFTVTEKGQKAIENCSKTAKDDRVRKYAQLFLKLEKKSDLPKKEMLLSRRENLSVYLEHLTASPDTNLSFDL